MGNAVEKITDLRGGGEIQIPTYANSLLLRRRVRDEMIRAFEQIGVDSAIYHAAD